MRAPVSFKLGATNYDLFLSAPVWVPQFAGRPLMILFKSELIGTKLFRLFWLLVGLAGTVAGIGQLLTEGIGSFIPWTVFLIGVSITLMAAFGPRQMLDAISL